MERVQLASVQTLWVRAMRSEAMKLPPADLLMIDECHHATATTWRKIIEAYPDAVLLGLTATPCRGDGRGLGGIFTCMIEAPAGAESWSRRASWSNAQSTRRSTEPAWRADAAR